MRNSRAWRVSQSPIMSRPRMPLLIVAACAACLGLAGPAAGATSSQKLFAKLILRDGKASPQVRALLRYGEGFVDPKILFSDLTGDGKSDASVLVGSGGAAGDVALFVFSTEGPKRTTRSLRAVLRLDSLYRATVLTRRGALLVRTPRYAPGEDLCCPATLVEQSYRWNRNKATFDVGTRVTFPGPKS
jgi:hypothetical protein